MWALPAGMPSSFRVGSGGDGCAPFLVVGCIRGLQLAAAFREGTRRAPYLAWCEWQPELGCLCAAPSPRAEVTYQISVVFHTPGFFSKAIRAVQVCSRGHMASLCGTAAAMP